VTYDREEWRRPWRVADHPFHPDPAAAAGAAGAAGPAEAPAAVTGAWSQDEGPGPAEREDEVATAAPDEPSATRGPAAPSGTRPVPGWQRPDGTPTVAPPAGLDATDTAPIARFPQPPPAGWDERSAGPGSPVGSVRPPDTTGTVDAPAPERRGRRLLGALLVGAVGAVIGTLATLALTGALTPAPSPGEEPGPPSATEGVTAEAGAAADAPDPIVSDVSSVVPAVAEAVTPSVVRVDVSVNGAGAGAVPGRPSLGSGVIYRSDGYILTNEHVVGAGDEVTVRLASGDILDAEVIGRDELNDLAVLKVEESGLPAIQLRDAESDPLIVGETVVAIGSPFGLDASVTAGVISALNREIRLDEQEGGGLLTIPSVIQTDAAINPGNSGGALVDAQGRLIGINTAILTASGANQGVGFAVSAEQAVVSADQLIELGFVRHPLLGIAGADVTPAVAERFGLPASRGAVIESVQEGTGAAGADLRAGDIIVAVDGEPLATMSELVAEVRRRQPGDEVVLTIVRDGEESEVEVVLSERPR
jgi:S1-C subfamily serine protease